jgi:hypothetical protein
MDADLFLLVCLEHLMDFHLLCCESWGFVVVRCYGSTSWTLLWIGYKGDFLKKNFESWCTSYMQGKKFLNLHMFDLHDLVFILKFFVYKSTWLLFINHHNG